MPSSVSTRTGSGIDQCNRSLLGRRVLRGRCRRPRRPSPRRRSTSSMPAGFDPAQPQPVPPAGRDRPRVDPHRGVGAGRRGRDRADRVPPGRRQLRAGRVRGAHEHHPRHRAAGSRPAGPLSGRPDDRVVQAQLHVAAPLVALGPDPADHPGLFQDLQVVGEQVGWPTRPPRPAHRVRRRPGEPVHDRQPHRFTQAPRGHAARRSTDTHQFASSCY